MDRLQSMEAFVKVVERGSFAGAADALGLAITHAHARASMRKLADAHGLQRKTSGMYRGGRSH